MSRSISKGSTRKGSTTSSKGSRAKRTPSKSPKKREKKGVKAKSALARVSSILPKLDTTQRKGDSGRMVVIGGSKDLALAAGFCAYAQVKSGSDQSTVFLHPAANADLLRQRFLAVVVHSTHSYNEMLSTLQKSNGVVIGPGLIGDAVELPLLKQLLQFAKVNPQIPVVIDANAIDSLAKCAETDLPKSDNVITTPNFKEFEALCAAFTIPAGSIEERAKKLARRLGMCVMVKSAVDTITDGNEVLIGDTEGSPRRTAGLGDMLAGLTALFCHYAKLANGHQNVEKSDLLQGSQAASDLMRHACRLAFSAEGRTMTVEEVLKSLVQAVKEAEPNSTSLHPAHQSRP